MKARAKAPANIAFIKYWGKKDERLRLPANNSLSMNLSEVFTVTEAEFIKSLKSDSLKIDGKIIPGKEKERVSKFLDMVRHLAGSKSYARVRSENNFPKGTGLASSASGFAALTLAATKAAGLNLNERKLSILARLGSGSACRSIPDGFVEWKAGRDSDSSFAYSLYGPDYWDIRDIIAVVGEKGKKVSSTEGHALAESSPFYRTRISGMAQKIRDIKNALKQKDFSKFGELLEEEAINMHAVMMTSKPPLFYWFPETIKIILAVQEWRDRGLEGYLTIDAGPNVHIICQEKDTEKIKRNLSLIKGIRKIIVNKAAPGVGLL